MAEEKEQNRHRRIIFGFAGLSLLALSAIGYYMLNEIQDSKSKEIERQTRNSNAIKGKVWMERADKAHDAGNHDKEFELLLKSASFNHAPAIFKISKNYETGNYVHQSDLKAQEWAAKLPKNQYIKFLLRRGYALTEPGSNKEDVVTGLKFLEDAIIIAPENQSKNNTLERMAWLYFQGDDSVKDIVKAKSLFETIGGPALERLLGTQGFQAEQLGDNQKARNYYQEAIDQGSTKAKVSLAYNYINDMEKEDGLEIADKLMQDVARSDDTHSRFEAAKYFIERGTQDDKSVGLKLLETLADDGFERSKLYLAEYYSDNPNVEVDYVKAAKHLEDLTYLPAKAKIMLAHMKRTGTGTTKDIEGAFKLYQDAANDSYDPAKMALAHMYRLGLGTSKDPQKAKSLYEAARYDKQHPASYYLGLMYEQGQAGPVNMQEAINLYTLASEAEYGPALMRLAKLYEAGQHIPKDTAKAFRLMTEAAYTADPEAIENLARYYSQGIGTEASAEYARIWRGKKQALSPFAFD